MLKIEDKHKRYDTNDGNTVMILDGIHTKRRRTIFSRIRMYSPPTDAQYTTMYSRDRETHRNKIHTFKNFEAKKPARI